MRAQETSGAAKMMNSQANSRRRTARGPIALPQAGEPTHRAKFKSAQRLARWQVPPNRPN